MCKRKRKALKRKVNGICLALISLLLEAQGMDQLENKPETITSFQFEYQDLYGAEFCSIEAKLNTPSEPDEIEFRNLKNRIDILLQPGQHELEDLMERARKIEAQTNSFKRKSLAPESQTQNFLNGVINRFLQLFIWE